MVLIVDGVELVVGMVVAVVIGVTVVVVVVGMIFAALIIVIVVIVDVRLRGNVQILYSLQTFPCLFE